MNTYSAQTKQFGKTSIAPMPCLLAFLCVFLLNLNLLAQPRLQTDQFVMLQVLTPEDTTSARFVAVVRNDSLFSDWNGSVKALIAHGSPYGLYFKGNRVGEFSLLEMKEEDEMGFTIVGVTHLLPNISISDIDTLGYYWFTAVSNGHSISLGCQQPVGYQSNGFKLNFKCGDMNDSIVTSAGKTWAKIELYLGDGAIQLVDSTNQIERLAGVSINDVFDLDHDGIPEILATYGTYPTWNYIVYKNISGRWHRWFEAFAGGD